MSKQNELKAFYLGDTQNDCGKVTGARIKAYRNRFNLTQEALGRKYNLAKNTISSYERGTYTPPLEFIISLCIDSGITLDEFYGLRPSNVENSSDIEELLSAYEKASPQGRAYILLLARTISKASISEESEKFVDEDFFSDRTRDEIIEGASTPIEECISEEDIEW